MLGEDVVVVIEVGTQIFQRCGMKVTHAIQVFYEYPWCSSKDREGVLSPHIVMVA
jgi:hypothetical protein